MRMLFVLLSCLLLVPGAFADCTPAFSAGGTGLSPVVSSSDRRELESLLGTQIDEAICAFINAERRRFGLRAPPKSGFFVLTPTEAVFVREGKTSEVLFRAEFAAIGRLGWNAYDSPLQGLRPVFDEPLNLLLAVGGEFFSFTLPCLGGATGVLNELERRISVGVVRPPGVPTPCAR